jgi:hypothetical protein
MTMPIRTPDGYDPVPKRTIAVTSDPRTRTIRAMKAALHEAFDREIARATAPRATFVNHTDDGPCILDPDRTLT